MLKFIRDNSWALGLAVVLHVALLGLLVVSLKNPPIPKTGISKVNIVQATAVDESKIQAELDKLKKEEQRRKAKEKARQRKLDKQAQKAKQATEREQKRLKEIKRKQKQEKKRLQAQQKKEQQRLAKLKKQQQTEKKTLEKIKREKVALEKKRKQEEKLATEKKKRKQLQVKKKREADARAKREREAQARRDALKKQMEAEEQAERNRQLLNNRQKYMRDISNRVQNNWLRPANVEKGANCKVFVQQIPGGIITSVKVGSCKGGSELFRSSVERAVYKSDPLPRPSDPAVFDREIKFTFTVEN